MKSAYQLAMERLEKSAPTVKLSDVQKKEIAELESRYKAKVAEREMAVKDEIVKVVDAGEFDKIEPLEKELAIERKKLEAELEEKKAQIRERKK